MKFLSTFSGVGGFEIPLLEKNHECVGYSEINKHAIEIYQEHFPTHHNYGDITSIEPSELPDFNLLCGGFPCQSFSIAGKRGGLEDTRGTLFFSLAEIARTKRPQYLFFENVKGLLNHDEGNTFATIVTTLDELGYDLQWQVCNSVYHTGQNRERLFIIGHSGEVTRPQVFPIFQTMGEHEKASQEENGAWYGVCSTIDRGYRKLRGNGETYVIMENGLPRWLTHREVERFQGFPEGWTASAERFDTPYEVMGNAVTVDVIRSIVERLPTEPQYRQAE